MAIDDAPVFAMLKSSMQWLNSRQKTLAENVANANTPGYTPRDISAAAFEKALASQVRKPVNLAVTDDGHIAAPPGGTHMASSLKAVEAPDSATTINGNSVVLEDQMTKVADTRMRYEMVVGLYTKSLNLVRAAAKSPTR